jgi:uncharacterized protein YgiM (DUF1202 family)
MRKVCLAIFALVFVIQAEAFAQESSAKASTDGSYAAEVTASRLHLRAGPGSSYQSVVLIEQGDRVIVREAAEGGWAVVEVPGGFDAWVSARFVDRAAGGDTGTVTVQNLLLRPRPSTRYHHLATKLDKGETLRVLGEETVGDEAWLKVRAPQRIPLYCAAQYLNKIGPASMALPKKEAAPGSDAKTDAEAPAPVAGSHDEKFIVVEKRALAALPGARTVDDLQPIRRTLASVDETRLSLENRRRRVALERKLLDRERELIVASVQDHEQELLANLEKKIEAIEAKYQARLKEIEAARTAKKSAENRYTAVGIIEYKPHLLGQTPAFRITNGGKLRYYVIAPAFDLHKFAGKRVGVIGLLDRESGTGYFTVMAKRIEIIGEK